MSGPDAMKDPAGQLPRTVFARGVAAFASPVGFAVAVVLTLVRVILSPLFLDFRDGLYHPTQAFFAGRDPYGAAYLVEYGVTSPFAYPPHALLLFRPFALLPYPAATLFYLLFAIFAILAIASLSVRLAGVEHRSEWFWGTATALLLSRPGHMAVVQGQPSLIVILAALVAMDDRARSWATTLAFAVTTIKPTFGAPLLALGLARGAWRQVFGAGIIALACALYPTLTLIAHAGGLGPFLTELQANQVHWLQNPDNDPVMSLYRIDAPALVSRLLGHRLPTAAEVTLTALLVASAALALRKRLYVAAARDRIAMALTAATVLVCIYHQTYDLLLLCPVCVALAAHSGNRTLLAMLAIAGVNYFASYAAMDRLGLSGATWLVVTSWNGIAVLAVFVTFLRGAATRPPGRPPIQIASRGSDDSSSA